MSFSGCSPTISPGDVEPSANVSSMAVAPSTTWRLVRMSPARLTTTPLPRPSSSLVGRGGVGVALGLDEHERRLDPLVHDLREGRRRRLRGEGAGDGVVDVLLGEGGRLRGEEADQEDRGQGHGRADADGSETGQAGAGVRSRAAPRRAPPPAGWRRPGSWRCRSLGHRQGLAEELASDAPDGTKALASTRARCRSVRNQSTARRRGRCLRR